MKYLLFLFLLTSFACPLSSQIEFSKWFTEESLRIDYILAGNQSSSEILLQSIKKEPYWGGSKKSLIDIFNYGEFMLKVFPEESSEVIYSRGFSTLFQEWQTTKEAKEIRKGFFQTNTIPFPKSRVRLEIYERNAVSEFMLKFSIVIDPLNYFIEDVPIGKYQVEKLKSSGNPDKCVDIVFVPEGYTQKQMVKFKTDILRLSDSLFSVEPFTRYKNKFNFYAVLAPSEEEGADIPGLNVWKNTLVNSGFYTFDSERYLTTSDYWKVRDIASCAPYDQICVLVNTDKYGGGGIFNHYSLTSTDNEISSSVFIHEFGHGFAGLGDEYYTSDVSYSGFYSSDTEPWEPNLTTLVNFREKWADMLVPDLPVPTPPTSGYIRSTGVFEGGGYEAKGVYRPAYDCRMKSNIPATFCKVCERSIEKMILFLTD